MDTEDSMVEIYDTFYRHINNSQTHSLFCEKVFGIDLSQDGFSGKEQLDHMMAALKITPADACLDIGCGNGRIANYIHEKTGACLDGIDSSKSAIAHASELFRNNRRLRFFEMNIDDLHLEHGKYSLIYLIDSIYFSRSYETTVTAVWNALRPNGRMAFFYSEFVFDKEAQTRKIFENETRLAKIFQKAHWEYSAVDFTEQHLALMKRKNITSNELKDAYLAEGNERIFEKVHEESVQPDMTLSEFEKFTNRYLYIVKKN
jgi:2-polyprenyl-3-methyl-5-hydroxy-6-metoxy-1,4-benzoquinol methylase